MDEMTEVREFILARRQATLAVCSGDEPFTAMTSYVVEPRLTGLLIQLSDLSPHKHMLLANPKCSLLIAEGDDGRAEVMSLARVTLQGIAAKIEKAGEDYAQAKARFLARLPASAIMFSLPDFDLFRIRPTGGRFIGGFGRAFAFTAEQLIEAADS
ncbi:MAG: pyridoxamine 5'-phosphate oxidase family protein [Anaerolineae bacterium]|nr:pyridoxamine 5'-phosphate oxidase family protein [Anaerolineae bacterium]